MEDKKLKQYCETAKFAYQTLRKGIVNDEERKKEDRIKKRDDELVVKILELFGEISEVELKED